MTAAPTPSNWYAHLHASHRQVNTQPILDYSFTLVEKKFRLWQCLTPPVPPSGCPFIPGDVNDDDVVSVLDLVAISNSILGLADLPEGSTCAADVDSNGIVNVTVSRTQGKRERGRLAATVTTFLFYIGLCKMNFYRTSSPSSPSSSVERVPAATHSLTWYFS